MATLAQIRDKADAKLATFWVALMAKQDAYFAKHGKYFQLLISPETNVVDGLDNDFTERVPSDDVHIVDRDFAFAEKIPFQIEVHEWLKPNNEAGYKAFVYVQLLDGRVFSRNRDSDQNDSGWFKVIKE